MINTYVVYKLVVTVLVDIYELLLFCCKMTKQFFLFHQQANKSTLI